MEIATSAAAGSARRLVKWGSLAIDSAYDSLTKVNAIGAIRVEQQVPLLRAVILEFRLALTTVFHAEGAALLRIPTAVTAPDTKARARYD